MGTFSDIFESGEVGSGSIQFWYLWATHHLQSSHPNPFLQDCLKENQRRVPKYKKRGFWRPILELLKVSTHVWNQLQSVEGGFIRVWIGQELVLWILTDNFGKQKKNGPGMEIVMWSRFFVFWKSMNQSRKNKIKIILCKSNESKSTKFDVYEYTCHLSQSRPAPTSGLQGNLGSTVCSHGIIGETSMMRR